MADCSAFVDPHRTTPPITPSVIAKALNPPEPFTLRDWFAGMAMKEQMASQANAQSRYGPIAMNSYMIADMMMKARED